MPSHRTRQDRQTSLIGTTHFDNRKSADADIWVSKYDFRVMKALHPGWTVRDGERAVTFR
jgi:hypothetical protein